MLRGFAPKPECYPHTSVIPQCVHNNLLSLSTCPQSSVRSQSILYGHVSSLVKCFAQTGNSLLHDRSVCVCVCVHFTCPLSHPFLPEWPWAASPHFVLCSELYLSLGRWRMRMQEGRASSRMGECMRTANTKRWREPRGGSEHMTLWHLADTLIQSSLRLSHLYSWAVEG